MSISKTDDPTDREQDHRNKSERRSETDRRTDDNGHDDGDRRDKTVEARRSYVGRRQAAAWRNK